MIDMRFVDETDVPLEFGGGCRHVDIRFGILNHGVLDRDERIDHRRIKLGVIGSPATIEAFLEWLDRSSDGVAAKESSKPSLFPRFPGFGEDSPFHATLDCESRGQRSLSPDTISALASAEAPGEIVRHAVAVYVAEIEYLVNETKPDVIVCIVTDEIADHLDRAAALGGTGKSSGDDDDDDGAGDVDRYRHDFHHCLKAAAMVYHTPLQLMLPSTFGMGRRGKSTKRKRPRRTAKPRQLQDEATRAWNLFTALYYKAGGVPWRLSRDPSDFDTCYVGIGFYRSLDESRVMTSIAQVFNQRGQGIVVRGGQARQSKDDRTPHLVEDDAAKILVDALSRYRDEHKNLPARVVLHKTSAFDAAEVAGFRSAIRQERIAMADMVSLRPSSIRLLRDGAYPVLRGSHVSLGSSAHLLYTRGSVPFYETYPGLYAPRALELGLDAVEQSADTVCREILALTKMNWNNTQFDMRDPITIRAARRVGDILKYIPDDAPPASIARRYSFYM